MTVLTWNNVDAWVWGNHGWENAAEQSVQPGGITRAEARARYQNDTGEHWNDIGVWKRWARPLHLDEMWEYHQEDDEPPPEGWEPHEGTPTWQFCAPDADGAVEVWICGPQADGPP